MQHEGCDQTPRAPQGPSGSDYSASAHVESRYCRIARCSSVHIELIDRPTEHVVAFFLQAGLSIIAFHLAFVSEMRSCVVGKRIKVSSNLHS